MVNIPITRQVTDRELGIILDKVAEDVIALLKEITIDYNPDITEDRLCEIIRKNSVDRDFISMFINWSGKSPYKKYKYCHTDVAEYLGYSSKTMRLSFAAHLKSVKPCNIVVKTRKELRDYVATLDKTCCISKYTASFDLESSGHGGHNTKFYFLNRVGFYQLCMASTKPKARVVREYFVEVYEAVMTYVCRSRKRNIDRLVKVKESVPIVEERIKKRVDDSLNKFNSKKMMKELEEKNESIKIMKNKIDEITGQKNQDNRIMSENNIRIKEAQMAQYEADEKVAKYKKTIQKLSRKIIKKDEEHKEVIRDIESKINNQDVEQHKKIIKKLKRKINKQDEEYKELIKELKSKIDKLLNKIINKNVKNNKQIKEEIEKNVKKDQEINRLMKLLGEKSNKNPKLVKKLIKPVPIITPVLVIIDEKKVDNPIVVNTTKYNKNIFKVKTVMELKDICRTNGIGGYSGMSKSVLIEWMLTKDKIMN